MGLNIPPQMEYVNKTQILAEVVMNKRILRLLVILVIAFSLGWFAACKQPEQSKGQAAPAVIKIGDREVQAKDEAMHKTREYN
ncbi:MAG TPA: hypothetical protein DCR87_02655, partial [Acidobacteria bacterium]|nr:hypothetical protein [Acidobacteriota bacterium]